ncbi:N-acyl amino acid synthase FeeM domain-containing protein [Tautonia plasticadhaerens]|uniref:N-acyl amino acid synthase FeeM catalytic core domain-containing protein n=1 Tax=Tautonia plasticadhaerens TaxID=2527974 RepID=A0A518H1Q7_9BACT|nr:hypothetical protein [Tautonia plasticadhaerens]QDV34773.1 hypothetical protein ElP_26690 [Tautonia plasticadhaerens]
MLHAIPFHAVDPRVQPFFAEGSKVAYDRLPTDRERRLPSRPEAGRSIAVQGADGGEIRVRIASSRESFAQAFRMIAGSYQARGYESPSPRPYRFTPYHVLPGTITVVAEREGRVVATMSQVPDTSLLGLPMERIYGWEIDQLRSQGLRLAEITSLADRDLSHREFLRVFGAMSRLTCQHHHREGGDSWVITVHPRHRDYYRKVLGFISIGAPRSYPSVRHHPAEGFLVDEDLMRANAPRKHREIFGEPLPDEVLDAPPREAGHVPYFAGRSTQADPEALLRIGREVGSSGAPPRWQEWAEPGPTPANREHRAAPCGS